MEKIRKKTEIFTTWPILRMSNLKKFIEQCLNDKRKFENFIGMVDIKHRMKITVVELSRALMKRKTLPIFQY